jgi:tripartite-type tricarboxylate transporter receptor subunit TctC
MEPGPSARETEMNRRMLLLLGLAPCARSFAQGSGAPAGAPVVIVVGGPPGTPGDLLARTLGGPLAAELGQPVVVENRPGAAGTVALGVVARSRPDGNLLGLMGLQSAVAPALVRTLPYDTARDLTPVRQLTSVSNVLVVRADSPLRSLDDVLKSGRESALTYASGGNATPAHLAAELFAQESRVQLRHIPFGGAVAGVTALLGGHVQLMFATIPAVAALVQAGKLRALATSSQQRLPLLPEVPTLAELAWPGAVMRDWHGLVAPAGTPADRIRQLSEAAGKSLAQDDVRERLAAQGLAPAHGSGPDEFRRWIGREMQLWSGIVQRAGISLQ